MTYPGLVYYAADYYARIYRQLRFVKSYLEPLQSSMCEMLQYELGDAEKRKALRYYPLLSVCALAENYTLLKGRKLTEIERKRITLMSFLATLCDDLIDEDGWNEQEMLDLLHLLELPYSKTVNPSLSKKIKLIVGINEELKKLSVRPAYWTQLKKAFHGQADSMRQHQAGLSLEETIDIARNKNGNYCLTVAELIDENWTEAERRIIYQHGMMGQMTNDIYDTYKDIHLGTHTMVTKVRDVSHLREIFIAEVKNMQQLIMQIDSSLKRKKKIIARYGCLDAFTMVGIDTLERAAKKYGEPLNWISIPKKDILPDMAKFVNRINYFKYAVWLSKA
ncbi:MAG: hypothetical protein JWN76_3384 [Chitinophagaceae bacterium]|nr:hypothetical protein [Chitinophagaceae bacterium]